MSTLADVFRELNTLKADGVAGDYAIGGATAVLFYAEPARTYDIDVFVVLPQTEPGSFVSLEPFYEWAREPRFPVDAEHILVHGVPVQFLPAHNALAEGNGPGRCSRWAPSIVSVSAICCRRTGL